MKEVQEISPESNPKAHSHGMLKLVLLLVILCGSMALVVMLKSGEFPLTNMVNSIKYRLLNPSSTSVSFIKFGTGIQTSVIPYGREVICAGDNGVKIYNMQGQETWSDKKPISKPLVRAEGRYMVVADLMGRNIYFYHNKREVWNQTAGGEILTISVNDRGYVGIIYKEKEHKNIVKVFNREGREILEKYCFNNYALDVRVEPEGQYVAIGELNISGLRTSAGITIVPLDGKDESWLFEDDSMLQCMTFMEGNLVAGYDKKIVNIDKKGNKTIIADLTKEKITHLSLGEEKLIAKVHKAAGFLNPQHVIDILNRNGKHNGTYELRERVLTVDAGKDITAVNAGDKVIFLNNMGEKISQFRPKKDVKDVHLFDNDAYAVIIYMDGADIVSIF